METTCFYKGGWSHEFISLPGVQRQGSQVTSLQSVLLTNACINTYAATTRALAILRLVWFLQTELFHIIGTNWGNGEIILVPEHSDFLLPTSPTLVLKDNNAPVSPCFFTAKKKKKKKGRGELVRSLLHPAGSWTIRAGKYTQLHLSWLPKSAHSGTVAVPFSRDASQGRFGNPSSNSPDWPQETSPPLLKQLADGDKHLWEHTPP